MAIQRLKPIIFYIILFLFILAISTMIQDYDLDLWARLIAGKAFIQTGHVLKQDFLSYTPTHQWIDHEWGSSVIFYLTQKLFSCKGLLFLQVMLTCLIYFFMIKVIELRGVKTTSAYNFLFYYFAFMAFTTINNPIRCHMFSFLFFTVFIYLFERARKGISNDKELLICVPLIMLFWCNLHGGCVAGIGLILLYIIGEFLNKKPIKNYIYALILSLAVIPINPWGLEYLKFLYQANTMNRLMISEWAGIFDYNYLDWPKFKIFALVLLLTEAIVIIKKIIAKQFDFDKTKILIVIVTLFLAVKHIKLIPFGVISMTCFLYDDFYTVFNTLTKNFFNKIANIKDSMIYLIIIIFVLSTIKQNGFGPYLTWSRYPVKAIEFIKINEIKGNLLQKFELGSYIAYKLYPQNKIYMDGRFEEVYDLQLLIDLSYFQSAAKDWESFFNSYPTDVLLIDKDMPVYKALKKNPRWKEIFNDNYFIVFVRYKDAKTGYKMPSNDLGYYKRTLFNTDINFGDKK